MTLTYAILTALVEEPCSGSHLARRFDKGIGHFWNCTHQQIYRELKYLEADGLVRAEPTRGRSGSHVYHLEPLGEQQLVEWIMSNQQDMPTRDPAMVRLRALASFEQIDVTQFIRDKRARHAEKLDNYLALDRKNFSGTLSRSLFIKKMVLDAGIRRERSYVEWCDHFLALAPEFLSPPTDADTGVSNVHPRESRQDAGGLASHSGTECDGRTRSHLV